MKSFILVFLSVLLSCTNNDKKQYAIKDFDKKLQPHLTKIVSSGILDVEYESQHFIEKNISKTELKKLSKLEIPMLQAYGFIK